MDFRKNQKHPDHPRDLFPSNVFVLYNIWARVCRINARAHALPAFKVQGTQGEKKGPDYTPRVPNSMHDDADLKSHGRIYRTGIPPAG